MLGNTVTRHSAVFLVALLCTIGSTLVSAQEQLLVEGIFDAEVHKTDADSYLLARNDGDISTLGRLQLWSAWQISSGFQLYAMGEFESDDSIGERHTEFELTQIALRYSSNSTPFYIIEAGKILPPISINTDRRLSTQNPLIAEPDILYAPYPLGIQLTGSSGWFDYRAALVDLPAIHPEYLPADPTSALRPDLGFGVTPFAGLRFGLAYTKGPYLNKQLGAFLPTGSNWKDFKQQLWACEFQFSHGYLELNGALIFSEYDVPFHSESMSFTDYFLELKYTWKPRLYGAVRFQKAGYPYIQHLGDSVWLSQTRTIYDLEIGLGYRFSANTQLKVAYRREHWNVAHYQEYYYPDGHSIALQLSHHFDLGSWFGGER